MADSDYKIVFAGQLVEGADPAEVRSNFAKLFKIEAARVEKLFSGNPVVIKKGFDEANARKYQAVLQKAGAIVELSAQSSATTTAATVEPEPAAPAPEAATTSTPPPSSEAASAASESPAKPEPAADEVPATTTGGSQTAADDVPAGPPVAPDFSVADPGVLLVEHAPVAAANIDTNHLDMAEVGVTLVEHISMPEPEFDLKDLTLAPPGAVLADAHDVPAAEYDTSALFTGRRGRPTALGRLTASIHLVARSSLERAIKPHARCSTR